MNQHCADKNESPSDCCIGLNVKLGSAFKGIGNVVWRVVLLSLVLACVIGVVDFLRNYPSQALLFPFSPIPPGQRFLAGGITVTTNGKMGMAWFDQFVAAYNIAFPGGCRLGSGIGTIAGAFWALFRINRNCLHERVAAGIVAGALAGGRMLLMFSDNAIQFFTFVVLGAVTVGVYMWKKGGQPKIPDLPIVSGIQSQPLS